MDRWKKIGHLKNEIALSVFANPCNVNELFERGFIKSKNIFNTIIDMMYNEDKIFYKKGLVYAKKEFIDSMNKKTIVEFKYKDLEREKLYVYYCFDDDKLKLDSEYVNEAIEDFENKTKGLEIISDSIIVKHRY